MDILVFKTSVQTDEHIYRVQTILNTIESVIEWSFDLDDCDNILRIVTGSNIPAQRVEQLLNDAGISCRELED